MNTHAEATAPFRAAGQGSRYSAVAIGLHWATVAALVFQVVLGWRIGDIDGTTRSAVLQMHKTIGIAILVLTVVRLAWRLANPPPAAESSLTGLEKRAAHLAHLAFYAALLALPLTGWVMVSAQRAGAMKLLGGAQWPDFPLIGALPGAMQDLLADVMDQAHSVLVWLTLALLALHVLGALKHHFVSRDPTVSRMAPGARPGGLLEPRLLAIPAIAAVLAAYGYTIKAAEPAARPPVAKLADADVFLDVVQPALDHRCASCHNDDQPKGGLSVTNYEGIRQGGRSGASILAGHPGDSPLLRRVSLPTGDPKYMPKDGKPALSASEITVIRWWIDQGAPRSGKISALPSTPQAREALAVLFGGEGLDTVQHQEAPLPVAPVAQQALIDKVVADGFIVRKLVKDSNLLLADYASTKPVTQEALGDLAKLSPQLFGLNLRHAGVSDAELHGLSAFTHLRSLRIEANPITDAGVKDIAALPDLAYLNLSNTKVSDAGFAQAAAMPKLKELYIWAAPVTQAAVDQVHALRGDLLLRVGLKPADVKVSTLVLSPTN